MMTCLITASSTVVAEGPLGRVWGGTSGGRPAGGALGHIAAAALGALGAAPPDPTTDEIADAIEAGSRPRDRARPQVLLIDPDQLSRARIATALTEAGYEVVAALRSGMTVGYVLEQRQPTVIVTELDLPPAGTWSGLMLIANLAKEAPRVPVLVIAVPGTAHLAGRAVAAGAQRMLPKSDVRGLLAAIADAHLEYVRAAYPPGGPDGREPGRHG
jgi:CheY-like chemotaxis protein